MERGMEGLIRRPSYLNQLFASALSKQGRSFVLMWCFGKQVFGNDALTMRLIDGTNFQAFSILLSSTALSKRQEADDLAVSLRAIGLGTQVCLVITPDPGDMVLLGCV